MVNIITLVRALWGASLRSCCLLGFPLAAGIDPAPGEQDAGAFRTCAGPPGRGAPAASCAGGDLCLLDITGTGIS